MENNYCSYIYYDVVNPNVFNKIMNLVIEKDEIFSKLDSIFYASNNKTKKFKINKNFDRFKEAKRWIYNTLLFTRKKLKYNCHLFFYIKNESVMVHAYTNKTEKYSPMNISSLEKDFSNLSYIDRTILLNKIRHIKKDMISAKDYFTKVCNNMNILSSFEENSKIFISKKFYLPDVSELEKNILIVNPVNSITEEIGLDNLYRDG